MKKIAPILVLLLLTLVYCDKANNPIGSEGSAEVIFKRGPKFEQLYLGKDYISGILTNIGNTTAFLVRVTFYFYKSEDATQHFESLSQNANPNTISPGKIAGLRISVGNLAPYCGDDGKIHSKYEITWD